MRKCKPIPCSWCRKEYIRWNSTQTTCSINCAIDKLKDRHDKGLIRDTRKAEKINRSDTRKRKEALKSRSDHEREAQRDTNAYIRERDKDETCISCKRVPKKRNAGHYKSIGAYPELRYHPFNIHLQCEHCNSYKSGNISEYRPNLIKKIGLENVEWLEGYHSPQNRTVEDIKEIKQYYKEQLKIIKL